MSWALSEIQNQIASEIDQDANAPAIDSNDYALRRTFINRSLQDWAETSDWPVLFTEFNSRTSVGSSLATISMPTDFRKPSSFVKITWDGSSTVEYPEIDPKTIEQYLVTDKFIYFLKGSGPTVNMIIHPGSIVSGASIYIPYQRSPGSLASPVSTSVIPDDTYLVQKTLYYLYKATEDSRFQEADQKAELILQRMLESEFTVSVANQSDRIKTWLETKHSFRIGESG